MPGATPRLALPYPVLADTADVPRDVKAAMDRIEALQNWIRSQDIIDGAVGEDELSATMATKFKEPRFLGTISPPVHEAFSVAQSAVMAQSQNDAAWQIQYNLATNRWHVVGGPPLVSKATSALTNLPNAWTVDPTVAIAVPYAGTYFLEFGGTFNCQANQSVYMAASEISTVPPAAPQPPGDLTSDRIGISITTGDFPAIGPFSHITGPWQFLAGTVRLYERASLVGARPAVSNRHLKLIPVSLTPT